MRLCVKFKFKNSATTPLKRNFNLYARQNLSRSLAKTHRLNLIRINLSNRRLILPSGELKFNQNFKGSDDLCRTTPTARSYSI